ncbi:MAG: ATP-binding cassette domain-containing protein [Arenicellales bacterium]|jgi:peptide/nickel transport system ATP-binding protein|nr:ATP-binding cassette domain-containing protein [Arenicellales bacterium]
MAENALLQVNNLAKHFDVSKPWLARVIENQPKQILKAVDGLSFTINKGETFSLVGESGCGKSTVAKLIVGLHKPSGGEIIFDGINLNDAIQKKDADLVRRRWQMIFQDPYASLNPRWRVRDIVSEPIRVFKLATSTQEISDRVGQLLTQVGLSPADGDKFPHEFSGGQRQRISIARALSSEPEFLVCDEPTSALDVSVQAQILNLMEDLQRRLGLTYMFISHNLAVVYHVSDKIGVMYLGRLCEVATAGRLFKAPKHPYTRLLLDTIPDMDMTGIERAPVQGEVPNPIDPPSGCTFHPRCPLANKRCRAELPELRTDGDSLIACHAVEENRDS